MRDSEFTKLLTRCSKAAAKHYELMDLVNAECQRRYGCSYSDIDADQLIDVLDIHGGENITAQYFDEQMTLSGAYRIQDNLA